MIYILLEHGIWDKVDLSCIPIQDSLTKKFDKIQCSSQSQNAIDSNML